MSAIRKVSNRAIRQAVNRQAEAIEDTIVPTVRGLVNDELKTRGRVDALEQFRDMGFWPRLRWLVRGYRG